VLVAQELQAGETMEATACLALSLLLAVEEVVTAIPTLVQTVVRVVVVVDLSC
jgi:hypothetical protein